jgi:hypothetical protein
MQVDNQDPRRELRKLPSDTPLLDRVLLRVEVDGNGCWRFQGAHDANGYGVINVKRRVHRAHVVTLEAERGPITKGLHVDHLCRVRDCCNPTHLEAVTPRVNVAERGRHSSNGLPLRDYCKRGHARTPENTYARPDGKGTNCLVCVRMRSRRDHLG